MRCFFRRPLAFTIVELMVSLAILALLLLVLSSLTDATRRTWSYTSGKVEQFREAREAFESVTRQLSLATLNTYWDYDNPSAPSRYVRQSELRFISGQAAVLTGRPRTTSHAVFFQAPLGVVTDTGNYASLGTLLNTWGYFVEFGDDSPIRPPFVTEIIVPYRHRFRLCEMADPSDSLALYRYTNGQPAYTGWQWFTDPLNSNPSRTRVLAENIVALIILPKLSPQEDSSGSLLAPGYGYDSTSSNSNPEINPKNQLPPMVQVSVVAVDEPSYNRFQSRRSGATIPAELAPAGLFDLVGDLKDPAKPGYAQDLKTLQDALQDQRIGYRVFTTNVSIKAAKWSREQSN